MEENRTSSPATAVPTLSLPRWVDWRQALAGTSRGALEELLAAGLPARRWFGSKARQVLGVRIVDSFAVTPAGQLALVEVQFTQGPSAIYQLPLAVAQNDRAAQVWSEARSAVWARVALAENSSPAVLYDALVDNAFCRDLLRQFDDAGKLSGDDGELIAWQSPAFAAVRGSTSEPLPTRLLQAEQSNSSVVFGDRLILKLYRRLETGTNPDLELNAHLTKQGFAHVPALAGSITYRREAQDPWTLAVLQQFVPNQGDAWQSFTARLEAFLGQAAAGGGLPREMAPKHGASLAAAASVPVPPGVSSALGQFLPDVARLGRRTAEMHLALAAVGDDPALAPSPFLPADRRALANRSRTMVEETFELLRRKAPGMPDAVRRRADAVLGAEARALALIRQFAEHSIEVQQIRCHGDYHLGQVLVAEGDYLIIDFEGEPARPLAERRQKQLALRDVAGMLRSFHYASCAAAAQVKQSLPQADAASIEAWAAGWYFWTGAAFLSAYRGAAAGASFVPPSEDAFERVLDACVLEKAVYELRYELNNRPDWVLLPLAALTDLLR